MEDISREEFFGISRSLEKYHSVFYKLWEMGSPVFVDRIPTAAVEFDKEGNQISFLFNPEFWKEIKDNIEKRDFVICHECLHVILNHGIRVKDAKDRSHCNRAMDVAVNHMLVNSFDMDRAKVDPDSEYCWVDTVFEKHVSMSDNESFEYYYNRILKEGEDGKPEPSGVPGEGKGKLVDSHDFLDGSESQEAIGKLNDELTDYDKESIKDVIDKHFEENESRQAGSEEGATWIFGDTKSLVVKKKKWETVIRIWSKRFLKDEFDTFEHWARVNRRTACLSDDILLPVDMELQEKEDKSRAVVYFFMDNSGSCSNYAKRFFKAARSLPSRRFDVKLFSFDTVVHEVDIKEGKLGGFGGTRFDILETCVKKDKYPEAIFVLTDGYGNDIRCEKTHRWYWFLTGQSTKLFIPVGCHKYNLCDFE